MKLKSSKLALLTASTAILTGAFATTAVQAREDGLTRLAHRLDGQVADFRKEIDRHFKHTGSYRHLVNDTNSMYRKTQHIDELSHSRNTSVRHLEADVKELDKLVHHIHDLLDNTIAGRTGGHSHGSTSHVHRLFKSIQSTVHAMEGEVERMARYSADSCPNDRYTTYNNSSRSNSSSRSRSNSRWDLFNVDTFRARFFVDDDGHDH